MAIPEHKFLSAHFTDNARTTVEVTWEGPNDETRVEHIMAEEDNVHWQNLLKHIDIDALHEATYKHIKDKTDALEDTIISIAKERGMIYDINDIGTDVYKALAQVVFGEFDPEKDKEKLFMFKLQLFEMDGIKKSTNRTKKKNLRQAKTMIEAMKVAISIADL